MIKVSVKQAFQDFWRLKFSRFSMAEVFEIFDGSSFQDF